MPSTLSPADQELIDFAAGHERVVTAKQLRVWRERGLLPRNVPRGLGQGLGSTSRVPEGARELVVWLARRAQRGGRPNDLALRAFADGLPVPEQTVRAAFRAAIDRIVLEAEQSETVAGIENLEERAERVADLVVETTQLATLVPVRVRRIDDSIRQAGLDGPPMAPAQLDRGSSSSEPVTLRDLTIMAVEAFLLGGPGMFNQGLGDFARMLAPAGSANPLASIVEHLDEDPEGVSVQEIDGAIPAGDLRDLVRAAVDAAPLEILKLGWETVAGLRAWAENLCEAVESELDEGRAGDALLAWRQTSFLPGRMLLVAVLAPGRRTPADQARTAGVLLFICSMLQSLRKACPDYLWELLDHPAVMPECVRSLMLSAHWGGTG